MVRRNPVSLVELAVFTGIALFFSINGFAADQKKDSPQESLLQRNCDALLKKGTILTYARGAALRELGRFDWVRPDSTFQWEPLTPDQFDTEFANGYLPVEGESFSFQGKVLFASFASREENDWLSDLHFRISDSSRDKDALISIAVDDESDLETASIGLFSNGQSLLLRTEVTQRARPFFSRKLPAPILRFAKISLKNE